MYQKFRHIIAGSKVHAAIHVLCLDHFNSFYCLCSNGARKSYGFVTLETETALQRTVSLYGCNSADAMLHTSNEGHSWTSTVVKSTVQYSSSSSLHSVSGPRLGCLPCVLIWRHVF